MARASRVGSRVRSKRRFRLWMRIKDEERERLAV
jgi:hypothetical protein